MYFTGAQWPNVVSLEALGPKGSAGGFATATWKGAKNLALKFSSHQRGPASGPVLWALFDLFFFLSFSFFLLSSARGMGESDSTRKLARKLGSVP